MRRLSQADLGDGRYGDARPKLALIAWFWAAYLMATHSNGISALQLQKQLGLGSYKTAWLLATKLRRAMVAPVRMPLAGLVEVDESLIACRSKDDPPSGGGRRSHQGKLLVAGAVEVGEGGPGRIRLARIEDFSADSLHAFLGANLAPGATARTDGWAGYPGASGITHDPHVVGNMAMVLPWVIASSPTSRPGRWASTTASDANTCNPTSFVFRFNRRRTRHAAFRSILGIGVAIKPATYKMLIAPELPG